MTHWKKLTNPNYLGVYSLENGKDMILTIDKLRQEQVIGSDGKKGECLVCYFVENVKPMIMNKTNLKQIEKLAESPMIEEWHGLRIQIGSEKVKAFGEVVDALRVRNTKPEEEKIACEKCGAVLEPFGNLSASQLAKRNKAKYGAVLCVECAMVAKKEQEGADTDGQT
ncbi:MAG: hypothetical protein IJS17_05535 [Clostridia bacterium]|nr:hypothetical protein [Clostridia bacterium]